MQQMVLSHHSLALLAITSVMTQELLVTKMVSANIPLRFLKLSLSFKQFPPGIYKVL